MNDNEEHKSGRLTKRLSIATDRLITERELPNTTRSEFTSQYSQVCRH